MSDGAHLGVAAGRALKTILGGESQPTDEECMNQAQFADWIRSTPHNLKDVLAGEDRDGYTEASRWLARRYLEILERAPTITMDFAWDTFKTRWPDDIEEAGGMTGFMHGWAWNAARHCLGYNPQQNPAILTIGPRTDVGWKVRQFIYGLWSRRYDWFKINLGGIK